MTDLPGLQRLSAGRKTAGMEKSKFKVHYSHNLLGIDTRKIITQTHTHTWRDYSYTSF